MSGLSASLVGGGGFLVGSRVTSRGSTASVQAGMAAAQSRLAETMAKVSSGKNILTPSQDVVGTDKALGLRQALAAEERYAQASSNATSWLGTAETALQSGIDAMQRVRDLAVQAGSGALSATGRDAIVAQLTTLREGLLSTANTSYLGQPVFGGTTGADGAFVEGADGVVVPTPGSTTGTVTRELAPGVTVRVDTRGTEAFGAGGQSVFAVLDDLMARAGAGTEGTGESLAAVDGALGRMTTALTGVGARYAQVASLKTTGTDRELSLKSAQADVEEVDLTKSLMELSMHQRAYEAALGAAAKVVTPSIMDFLR